MILLILRVLKQRIQFFRYKLMFKEIGPKTILNSPLQINGGKNIYIGEKTIIQYKTWLAAMPLTGQNNVELRIGNGCAIGHFNEIYATKSIVIEDNVLTADRVYITDNLHGYNNPAVPVINQPIKQISTVIIGEGSWLGVGVAVIGANIGKHCIIGANAVVTKDIPDYCVAVGIPAKIIKRYNFSSNRWEKTKPDGSFLKKES